jgi:ComF family protein
MSHDGLWCSACDLSLPYLTTAHCPVCALPTPRGEVCGHCLTKPPVFHRTVAVFGYQFPLDRLIQQMKYHEQLALAHVFAEKLIQAIDQTPLPDFIIAMPLHPAKLQSRGFNQAQLLAAPLSRHFNIPLLSSACHRLRDTPSQTSLPWKERSKNMRSAFGCNVDFTEKHIALVDDVMTTGASLNALAEAVKKRGARQISAWVVARTIQD